MKLQETTEDGLKPSSIINQSTMQPVQLSLDMAKKERGVKPAVLILRVMSK